MAEKHYLFQKSTGEWVFGPTTNSVIPAGLLRLANVSETNIELRWVHNKDIAYRYSQLAYGDFLQENGTAYASLAAFVAATKGFFAGKISATIEAGDIQIGAVELKNADTDDRAKIATGSAMATSDKALAVADATLRSKQFAENGIHLLTGTSAAPTGTYAGFIPLASDCAISSITVTDTDLVTGANDFDGVTLVQGMYYEIPGGFSAITLSAGDMILVKA